MQEDGYVDMGALLRAPRFWRQPRDGTYLVRACQGHSVSHVRDELLLTALSVRDTPEYAAHGPCYDLYESVLRQGLVAARAVLPPPRSHDRGAPMGGRHLRHAQRL